MSRRRISIHDYPEHLNPFHEDATSDESKANRRLGPGRRKTRQSVWENPWSNLTGRTKSQVNHVVGQLVSFKSRALGTLSHSRARLSLRPEDCIIPSLQTPAHDGFVLISPKLKNQAAPTEPIADAERTPYTAADVPLDASSSPDCSVAGNLNTAMQATARAKRNNKKRLAPTPPVSPAPAEQSTADRAPWDDGSGRWQKSVSVDSGVPQSPCQEDLETDGH